MEFPSYPASVADNATFVSSASLRKPSVYGSFRTISCPEPDEQSAFYFALQSPKESRDEFSSFLYLDLADASSLRRMASRAHKPDARTSFLTVASPDQEDFAPDLRTPSPDFTDLLSATLRFADTPYTPTPTTPMSAQMRRRSRDHLPSPKPAPSSLLPPVPLNLPSAPPSPVSASSHSHSHSAPSILSSFLPGPRSSRTKRTSTAPSGSSIASHQRRANRSNALACLEGRSRSPHRIARAKTNFISLSDDDDDDDDDADDEKEHEEEEEERTALEGFVHETRERDSVHLHDAMLIEDEDVVMPVSPSYAGRLRSHSRAQKSRARASTLLLNITVPPLPASSRPPMKTRHSRSLTLESWFPPLANFIDLADDEVGRWRSFVEVGSP